MINLSVLQAEVQARCDALTNASTAAQVLYCALEAYSIQVAGGVITRTVLDVQLQRITNATGSGTSDEQIVLNAAVLKSAPASSNEGVRTVKKFQLFTASGTWTVPANINGSIVWVTLIGGGASGVRVGVSAPGCSGGGGGEFRKRVLVDIGASTSIAVVVGTGGGSSASTTGNPGTPSSFGTLAVAGAPAAVATAPSSEVSLGTSPGYTSVAISSSTAANTVAATRLNVDEAGSALTAFVSTFVANGGGGVLLGSTYPSGASTANGKGGVGYGAGGAGLSASAGTAGAGAPGVVLVEWEEYV